MAYEKLVSTNYKWKVLKRKKPPKWWLISSYKNVLQVLSGGLFTDAKMLKYITQHLICRDFAYDVAEVEDTLAEIL